MHPRDKKRWEEKVAKYEALIAEDGEKAQNSGSDSTKQDRGGINPLETCRAIERFVEKGETVVIVSESVQSAGRRLSRTVGKGGQVICISSDSAILEKRRDSDNCEYRLGTIQHAPVADHVADSVILYGVLEREVGKYRDLARIVKDSGQVVFPAIVLVKEEDILVYDEKLGANENGDGGHPDALTNAEVTNILVKAGLRVNEGKHGLFSS